MSNATEQPGVTIVGKKEHRSFRWLAYVFLIIMCVIQLLPFWLAICASSKPSDDLSSSLFLRFDFEWSNFATAITDGGILKAIVNSVIITLCSTVITCLVGAAAALMAALPIVVLYLFLQRYFIEGMVSGSVK